MDRYYGWLFLVSLIVSFVCFWNRNNFDSELVPARQLLDEPRQTPTRQQPFKVTVNDQIYEIYPQYEYTLSGMVVSYRHHDGNARLHKAWNDHLNMADVCVVWGTNLTNVDLNDFEFRNAQFTCFYRTDDAKAWHAFDATKLSNNHLISGDPLIRKKVMDMGIGDQIHIRGWLASYGQNGSINRGTSTVRTDTGNGACETIYVKHFHIMQEGNNSWFTALYISLLVNLILAFFYFRQTPVLHQKIPESIDHEQLNADRL